LCVVRSPTCVGSGARATALCAYSDLGVSVRASANFGGADLSFAVGPRADLAIALGARADFTVTISPRAGGDCTASSGARRGARLPGGSTGRSVVAG
jgi:hypothetical protein